MTRKILILAALLLGLQGCAPKENTQTADKMPAKLNTQAKPVADSQQTVEPGEGRGTVFVDDAFVSFEIPDCTLDDASSLALKGSGESEDGTGFEITIDGADVKIAFADGRTISGSAPEPLQVRNGSLSGQFELDRANEPPSTGLLFAECAR